MSCQFEVALPEAAQKDWCMSPSLSSATTTDEDFPFCGSPKQRWADLSEEDDDLFAPERNPFEFLSFAEKEETQDSPVTCADKVKTPIGGDETHNKNGTTPNFFVKRQARSGQDLGMFHDKKQNICGMVAPFGMLPPSVESHMLNVPPQSAPASSPLDKAATSDIFTVNLGGIPVKLCNETCLDAILWAAGVQRSVLGYKTKKQGHITIDFDTLDAATSCCNHFKACAWTTGKLHVEMVLPHSQRQAEANRRQAQQSTKHTPAKHSKNSHAYQMW